MSFSERSKPSVSDRTCLQVAMMSSAQEMWRQLVDARLVPKLLKNEVMLVE
jgi:hypothetical protein